jgi:hypothetical protein
LTAQPVPFLTREGGRQLVYRASVNSCAFCQTFSWRKSFTTHPVRVNAFGRHRWISTGPLSDDLVVEASQKGGPMETFHKLFASLLVFVYHCFDRVVIQGYLPLLTRPEHIVYFFRDVHGIYPITKQVLRQRTDDYQRWVEAFARKRRIPLQWPDPEMKKKGLRQEDYARPYLRAMERRQRFGVYFIFKTMEPGPNFRSCPPKTLPKILTIASSGGNGLVTVTITSTFAMKLSAP